MRIAPVRSPDGAISGYIAIKHDVSDQNLYKQRLRESEERFRSMADGCPSLMWVTGANGEVEFVNRACRTFYSVDPGSIQSHQWDLVVHPDDAPAFNAAFLEAVATRSTFSVEARVRRADGAWRLLGTRAEPRFSPSGQFLGHVGLSADITEREQAGKLRDFQHSLLRTIYDASLDGILVVDEQANVVSRNKRLLDVWRIDPSELPLHYGELPDAPNQPILRARLERIKDPDAFLKRVNELYADHSANDQCEIELKDGRTIERYSTTLHREAGDYLGRVWFFRDITGRKQAEQALRHSEEKFRQLAENIREVFWMMNAAGTEILYISPAYEQIWGRSCQSLCATPMDWVEAIHPEDREQALAFFGRQLQGESIDSEYRILTPCGDEKWIRDRAFPVRDHDGQIVRIAGIAEEITERKRSESLLKQTADRLTLATRAGGVGIWENDLVNRILTWDEQMFRLYGITRDQFGGAYETWLAGLHPEDRQQMNEKNEAAIRGEKEFDGDFRVVWPDGSVHHIRALAQVRRDPAGKATHIVGTNWDITDQKHAATELLKTNRRLESATARAKAMAVKADAANRAKSSFLANMSHEIRTPMNGVIGMNQLLLETSLTPEQRRYVEVAQSSGRALLALIDDILDLSKIEAGKVELEIRCLGLRAAVDEVVELLRERASAKNLRIESWVSSKIPKCLLGDVYRFRQVLTNLCANAIKFTDRGIVTVQVELDSLHNRQTSKDEVREVQVHEDRVRVRFTITDTGIGIAPDKIPALFAPFVQADASTTRRFGGTGLGLAISRQLVEMMGGTIGVESREGQGSTFWFTAIFHLSPPCGKESDSECQPSLRAPFASHRYIGSGHRILVAEDNPTNREVILAQLKKLGYRAIAAPNGAEALKTFERETFDLVLMDCQMPQMDGFETTRQIRNSLHSNIPIIALTASAMLPDKKRCLAAGMNDYLAKPVEFALLAEKLSLWLNVSPDPGPDPSSRPSPAPPSSPQAPDVEPLKSPFDEQSLLRRLLDDRQLAAAILQGFIHDAPSQFDQLRYCIRKQDAPGIMMLAHTMKGSAATVGADTLHDIVLAIEAAARKGNLENCASLLSRMLEEFEHFYKAVESRKWLSQTVTPTV